MKKLLIIFLCFVCFGACKKSGTDPFVPTPPVIPPVTPPVTVISHKNLYVDGKSLKDSSGHIFVMRGNNFPVFWFPSQYKPAIHAASFINCNAARLVWQLAFQTYTPSLAVLDEAMAASVANKMVPIVELHDFTGGTSAGDISSAANYFTRADVKTIIDKYSSVAIINLANEWGNGTVTPLAWKNAYLAAITIVRNAGYKLPIMIDAPGYGQSETAIVQYGVDLLNADPEKNIIFSTHAYSNWNSSSTYASRIANIQNQNLCFVFGEFGWNVPDDQQPLDFNCKVDAPLLMQLCQQKSVGYLGWSWYGNDAANACFDICKSWTDTSQLTAWGRQWAYDVNGVKNTGVKASVFQ